VVGRGYADRFVIVVVVDGKDDGDAPDRGDRTGAWQLRARLDTAHRMDRAQGHTAEPPGWDGALIDLMGSRRWHAGNEGHAPEEMRQRLDPTSCWGDTPVQAEPVAISVLQERGCSGRYSPLNPRCRGILAKAVGASESHRTRGARVREPSAGALGLGGPKRSANRGASDYGAMSLVERLNQTVSIHPDMTDAPTHYHRPHSHGCQHAPPTSPPRPTANPNRADLGGQSRC
jgi:hypothetical protein